MVKILVFLLVGLLGLPSLIDAHGRLTSPNPRPYSYQGGPNAPAQTCNGPVFGTSPTSMRCHDVTTFSPSLTSVAAGSTIRVQWNMEAAHPGDCSIWLSYDDNKQAPEKWIKLKDLPGCLAQDGLNPPTNGAVDVLIPANLPPCDHCVLRWEWYTVQQVTNVEVYVNCADIKITGGNPSCSKPAHTTSISGIDHLLKNHHSNAPQPASGCPFYNPYNGGFDKKRTRGPLEWKPECGATNTNTNTNPNPNPNPKPNTNTNTNTNPNPNTNNNPIKPNTNKLTSEQCQAAIRDVVNHCQ